METPQYNSENSLLNNSLSGLVAGLGMKTPVSMSSMKTSTGNQPGHMAPPNSAGQRPGGMHHMGTPSTMRAIGARDSPSPMIPPGVNASGHTSSTSRVGESRGLGGIDLTSAFSYNSGVTSSPNHNGNNLGGRQAGGMSGASSTHSSTAGGAAPRLDPTALKFLDSFATKNSNGRGPSSPMVPSGRPSTSGSQTVPRATSTPALHNSSSPTVSNKPHRPASTLGSSPTNVFADITKDPFLCGSPKGRSMGTSTLSMTGSSSASSSVKNLDGLESGISLNSTRSIDGSGLHATSMSTNQNTGGGTLLFGLDSTASQDEQNAATDADPFGNFVSASVDPMPSSQPVHNEADSFSDFVGAFSTKDPTDGAPASGATPDIFDSLATSAAGVEVQPASTETVTDDIFNLDVNNGGASTSGKTVASAEPESASVPVDSLFDFPTDVPSSSSQQATDLGINGDLLPSTYDGSQPTQSAQLDPFAAIPVDASVSVDSGPPDLDSFFSTLPTGANPPSTASPLDDLFGPAPPPSQPARAETVDDLFTQMNIGPSKPAPARAPDGLNLSALYGDRPGAAPQAAPVVGEVSWDLGDAGAPPVVVHEEGEEGEPEERARLRKERLARVNARVQSSLQENREREMQELQLQQAREQAASEWGIKLDAWINKNKGNIRALLGSMETVLWEGHDWAPVKMTDLISPPSVKKAYRKALLVIHPDKVKQRECTPLKMYIADAVFDCLKEAWGTFQSSEL